MDLNNFFPLEFEEQLNNKNYNNSDNAKIIDSLMQTEVMVEIL